MASGDSIPDNVDLITEILVRLPAKPLIRFKCVSKQWISLISDPSFCRVHTLRHHTPHSVASMLLLNNGYTPSPHFQTVPLRLSEAHPYTPIVKVPNFDYLGAPYVKILQSCNGLLLCSTSCSKMKMGNPGMRYFSSGTRPPMYLGSVINDDSEYHYKYFVCNPTTQQFVTLPFPRQMSNNYYNKVIFQLIFDPLRSRYFKVISINQRMGCSQEVLGIEVYSSEDDSWIDSGVSFDYRIGMGILNGVFFDGSIHWYCDGKNEHGLYFNVDRHCLKKMPMPTHSSSGRMNIMYFGESRGNLCMMRMKEPRDLKFDVWEMEEDYSGWSLKHFVNLHTVRRAFPEISWKSRNDYGTLHGPFSVLSMICLENEEDSTIVLFVDHKALCYKPKHQSLRKLCDLEPCSSFPRGGMLDYYDFEAFQYIESLSSL